MAMTMAKAQAQQIARRERGVGKRKRKNKMELHVGWQVATSTVIFITFFWISSGLTRSENE